jgi:hypothetical protein
MGCVNNYCIDHGVYTQPLDDSHQKATEKYREFTGSKVTYYSDDYKEAMDQGPPSTLSILCSEDVDLDHPVASFLSGNFT